jgi:hypothetical protein
MIAGSRFLGISNTNNFTKSRENSKSLFGVSIDSRISRLMKKQESKISLDCPFKVTQFTTWIFHREPNILHLKILSAKLSAQLSRCSDLFLSSLRTLVFL